MTPWHAVVTGEARVLISRAASSAAEKRAKKNEIWEKQAILGRMVSLPRHRVEQAWKQTWQVDA